MADINFKEDEPLDFQELPTEAPGALEASGRGLLQGATLGFGDELYGAGSSAVSAIKKGSISDLVKDYIESRNEVRQNNDRARSAHPYLYTAGALAGGIAPAALAPAGLLGASAVGGAAGAGFSNANTAGGVAKDTAIGAATGAALNKVAGALGSKFGNSAESAVPEEIGPTSANPQDWMWDNPPPPPKPNPFSANFGADIIASKARSNAVSEVALPAAEAATPSKGMTTIGRNVGASIGRKVGRLAGIPGGSWAGDLVGAHAGEKAAELAPQAMQVLQNAKVFTGEQLSRVASSPYATVLKNAAASGGPAAVATTHYILQQTDPEYQKVLKEGQE